LRAWGWPKVRKKRKERAINALLRAMHDAGGLTPVVKNLRLDQAEAMIGPEKRDAEYQGTRQRLARGDNLEW
jgi:hypothetical protein